MKILLIEDEDPKLVGIQRFLKELDPTFEVAVARSVKGGIFQLKQDKPSLLLLDMSLPTFDITSSEPGGRPQGFGGIEIIRYLDSVEDIVPTIVVSAYEAFTKDGKNIELKELAEELRAEFPETIRGVVFFNPIHGAWSEELAELIETCRE
jgi:CheY-like chemotaxis protein